MREKITKNRNTILMVLGILILVTFNIGMRYLATRPRYKTLPEVRLVNQKEESTKGFAIMVPNESGDGYVEYEGDTWPSEEDNYVFKEAKCIDNDGEIVENAVTFKDGKVELQTASTVYCTLYFDKYPEILKKLREKDTQGYLSTDLQGGMYRYQGTDNVPNYICFGTKSQSECINNPDKYMYRIIGITEKGQLYLIKNTFIKEGSNTTAFQWHSSDALSDCLDDACVWPNVDLFKRLNGNGGTINKTNLFIDSTQYDYLKSENNVVDGEPQPSEWYKLIESHNWMYGDIGSEDRARNSYMGSSFYGVETGAKPVTRLVYVPYVGGGYMSIFSEAYRWPETNTVTAKISLMYVHDYYYAYYDGSSESTRGNASDRDKAKDSWIFFQKDNKNSSNDVEWFGTRIGVWTSASDKARYGANNMGDGGYGTTPWLTFFRGVRPVFYLSSSVLIKDSTGSITDPFILEV